MSRSVLAAEYIRRIEAQVLLEPQGGFDPRHYPAEVIASVHALGVDNEDPRLVAWSERELSAIEARLSTANGFHIWPTEIDGAPTFGELAQSRMVLSLALIHERTGLQVAKRAGLSAYRALERLPRMEVRSSVTGKAYHLPAYVYHDPSNPFAISSRTLDPNHDAALAAAYSVAADSLLDSDADIAAARERALGYFAAAMDMATTSGCLPLADQPGIKDQCDTRYNGFWLPLMMVSAKRLLATNADPALNQQYLIVRQWAKDFQTSRTYPTLYSGPYPDPVEPLLLSSAVARYDNAVSFQDYISKLNAMIEGGSEAATRWPAGWLYPKYFRDSGD